MTPQDDHKPVLLLGMGATKAGTSWLYRYLFKHPDCALRGVKELHYFDTFDADERSRMTGVLETQIANMRHKNRLAVEARDAYKIRTTSTTLTDLIDLKVMLNADRTGDAAYIDYHQKGGGLMADITPAYGMMDAHMMARMAALPVAIKVVYLIRDPLQRLWSHVRMLAQRSGAGDITQKARDILDGILHHNKHSDVVGRGDYAQIIPRLKRAFSPHQLMFLFNEELALPHTLERLCAFLGISVQHDVVKRRVHTGPDIAFPETYRADVGALLKHQYDFMAQHFSPLPATWHKYG